MRPATWFKAKAFPILVALAVSVAMLGHWVFPLATFPASGGGVDNDSFQAVWNLWFASEALAHGKNPFVTPDLYYPLGANLAHHTLTPGYAPFAWLVEFVSRGSPLYPLYAFRLLPLAGFALSMLFTYWLLQSLGFGAWVRSTLAVAYTFSRLQVHHLIHPNYIAHFFVPLCGWQLVRLYQAPSRGRAHLAAAALGASVYFTEIALYLYLAVAMLVALLCSRSEGRRRVAHGLRILGPRSIATSVALFLVLLSPYAIVLRGDSILEPPLQESVQYSSNLLGFLVPAPGATPIYGRLFTPIASHLRAGIDGSEVFLGFVTILPFFIALVFVRDWWVCGAALLAALFCIASLGPSLNVLDLATNIPMPYALLGRLPIFESGRTPVRFVAIAALFAVVVAAAGLTWIERRLRGAGGRSQVAVLVSAGWFVWAVAESLVPTTEKVRFVVPAALATLQPGPVLNLPPREKDGYAAFLQTLHRQPIATGYTARISAPRLRQIRELRRLFDRGGPEFWSRVERVGFRTVIVAPHEITAPYTPSMTPLGPAPPGLRVLDLRAPTLEPGADCDAPHLANETPAPPQIDFATASSTPFLCYGWGEVEEGGRWTIRGRASFRIGAAHLERGRLRLQATPFLVPGKVEAQRVDLVLNGRPVAHWEMRQPGANEYRCEIPPGSLRPENRLELLLPDAEAPLFAGTGADRRTLGIRVEWVRLESAAEP